MKDKEERRIELTQNNKQEKRKRQEARARDGESRDRERERFETERDGKAVTMGMLRMRHVGARCMPGAGHF